MTAIAGLTGVSLRRAAISFSYRALSRRLLSRCPSPASTPVLLGHFFHPCPPYPPDADEPRKAPPSVPAFQPLAPSAARLSLDFVPFDVSRFALSDSHLGLLLLLSRNLLPTEHTPRLLVCDPARRLHVMLPPPPCATSTAAGGRFVGAALLSRAVHPTLLRFEAVCLTVDVDRPRAWVASFDAGQCRWRALPRPQEVIIDFDPFWLETHCVRAAGSLYWHICRSDRVLALDAATLEFSFLPFPVEDPCYTMYRVGEMPEDGRLCIGSMEEQLLQLWVRGDGEGSDRGWVLETEACMRQVFDAVPRLPRDPISRMHFTLDDIDAGRTGRVFIRAWVSGHYSYHLDTGKLECLATEDGMEYNHPIRPYFSYPNGGGSD